MSTSFTSNLRPYTSDLPVTEALVTAILIRGSEVRQEHTKTGKRELLSLYQPGDKLMAAWTGNYRTNIFDLPFENFREAFE